MDLLLSIQGAQARARALEHASAQSVVLSNDCGALGELCGKVLPLAFVALEDALGPDMDTEAASCVQALSCSMSQLQSSVQLINQFQAEGMVGVLLEHGATWLEVYRGFRALTAQLVALSCIIRGCGQRRRGEGAHDALQASVKTFTAICARARDAATLLGSDLPDFARAAALEGWSAERLRTAACGSSRLPAGPAARRSSCSSLCEGRWEAAEEPHAPASPGLPHPTRRPGLLGRLGLSGKSGSASPMPVASSGAASPLASSPASGSGPSGPRALEGATASLVCRIQDTILHDSELDQLEQDRAYLQHRIANLRGFSAQQQQQQQGGSDAAGCTASLLQSEVLLAAVEARVTAKEAGDQADSAPGTGRSSGMATPNRALAQGWASQEAGPLASASGRRGCVDSSHAGDEDWRRRRPGLRWLPLCFAGAA
ncbi:hypothetical protein HYH03_002503 [Edaphochlamys debaryana]|uniref:Uncharacterized protein n=1 Tax=Edaphochlamys debaryana TaxID=47281 RepID=A0A836C532_9CHLO|nr:hypothetical protein HYH03_002503 [Edaphochlamys debaryana]|eukprot:KAG2499558.1 hypothetical protein HYH03_002503 [Edaphochlamys debaryana]